MAGILIQERIPASRLKRRCEHSSKFCAIALCLRVTVISDRGSTIGDSMCLFLLFRAEKVIRGPSVCESVSNLAARLRSLNLTRVLTHVIVASDCDKGFNLYIEVFVFATPTFRRESTAKSLVLNSELFRPAR